MLCENQTLLTKNPAGSGENSEKYNLSIKHVTRFSMDVFN